MARDDYELNIYNLQMSSDDASGVRRDMYQERAKPFNHLIKKYFPCSRDVGILDLGCGDGAFIYFLEQHGYKNIAGVDLSERKLAIAKTHTNAQYHEANVMDFVKSLEDDSQDVIIAKDIVEHLDKTTAIELSLQINRVLKKSGFWLIHVPNAESPLFGRIRYGDYTHQQAFTQSSILQMLYSTGFKDVHCFEDGPIAKGLKGVIRFLIWKCIRCFLRLYLMAETGYKQGLFTQNIYVIVRHS